MLSELNLIRILMIIISKLQVFIHIGLLYMGIAGLTGLAGRLCGC